MAWATLPQLSLVGWQCILWYLWYFVTFLLWYFVIFFDIDFIAYNNRILAWYTVKFYGLTTTKIWMQYFVLYCGLYSVKGDRNSCKMVTVTCICVAVFHHTELTGRIASSRYRAFCWKSLYRAIESHHVSSFWIFVLFCRCVTVNCMIVNWRRIFRCHGVLWQF